MSSVQPPQTDVLRESIPLDPADRVEPDTYGPTPSYSQSQPFYLPKLVGRRHSLKPKDVMRLYSGQIVWYPPSNFIEKPPAELTEIALRVVGGVDTWLTMDEDELWYDVESGRATILAAEVPSPQECWWMINTTPTSNHFDPGDLNFKRIRNRKIANEYLSHPVIDHDLGGVVKHKAIFAAVTEYGDDEQIVALAVMGRPGRMIDDGQRVVIRRYASHPLCPDNTATWFLSRLREWATTAGYRSMRTHAGVSHNTGIMYKASNFTHIDTVDVNGDEDRREGRMKTGAWMKRIYNCTLDDHLERGPHVAATRTVDPSNDRTPLDIPDSFENSNVDDDISLYPYINTNCTTTSPFDNELETTSLLDFDNCSSHEKVEPADPPRNLTEDPVAQEFLSPENVGFVRLDETPTLTQCLTDDLPVRDVSRAITRSPMKRDTVPSPTIEPDAIFGAHRDGQLVIAYTFHHADTLREASMIVPESVPDVGWMVTGFAAENHRGMTNVAAWLLGLARTWTEYTLDDSLHVADDITIAHSAATRAQIPTVSPPEQTDCHMLLTVSE